MEETAQHSPTVGLKGSEENEKCNSAPGKGDLLLAELFVPAQHSVVTKLTGSYLRF